MINTFQSSFSTNEQHRNGHSMKTNVLKNKYDIVMCLMLEKSENGVGKAFPRLNNVLP